MRYQMKMTQLALGIITSTAILLYSSASISAPPAASGRLGGRAQLAQALDLLKSGQNYRAANALFALARHPDLENEKTQIRYILGLTLLELKLYQVAAFQFVGVIKDGESKYLRQAIEKLSVTADILGDETLLNYAVSQVKLADFPAASRDMLYFRLGEARQRSGKSADAIDLYSKVPSNSKFYDSAQYNLAVAYAEDNKPEEAAKSFKQIIERKMNSNVLDPVLVTAQLGYARALYQGENWDAAAEAYRSVPRDSEYWHEAGFEMGWALLRGAKFRTALSGFVSLHSPFYDDYYMPESLLLRSIIYLFICKYDESEKVLNQFEAVYAPVRQKLTNMMKTTTDPLDYYQEIERAQKIRQGKLKNTDMKFNYLVGRKILTEGDVRRATDYLKKIVTERNRIEKSPMGKTPLGKYSVRLLNNRIQASRVEIGELVKVHIGEIRSELSDLYEQSGFIRFEMVNGRKESLKKKIAGKEVPVEEISQSIATKFSVQNGYELWPFQGEYWRDELWNFQYLGRQACD